MSRLGCRQGRRVRYLAIWENTDFDNSPGVKFPPRDPNLDSYFILDGKFPSQWFYAALPRHPMMYYSTQQAMAQLLGVLNVKAKYLKINI